MPLYIRLGDTSDHGGAVVTSASYTKVEGQLVARVGDMLDCPIHGINAIVEGSSQHSVEGHLVARQGDHTECGAALISSAQYTTDGAAGA